MTIPDPPSPHVEEELPGLFLGDLGRDDTLRIAGHLRTCPDCRADLVGTAVAFGSIAASKRTLAATADLSGHAAEPHPSRANDPLPPLPIPSLNPHRKRRRVLAAVGATAAALALVAAGITLENQRGRGTTRPTAALTSAPLKPISAPPDAGGKVTIALSDGQVIVDIHISGLPSPGPNRFYEAWLFDPATNKMMAMGVLAPAATTTFEVAGELLQDYSALDISLQANNGNPAHSTTSVLRATQI